MIFVDTSVWVAFLRGRDATLVEQMRAVLDSEEVALAAPVRIEILSGAARQDLPRLRRLLGAFALFVPTNDTWQLVDDWLDRAARSSQRFGAMDLLIGALAAEQRAALWSLDRDFERMARLGLLGRYSPPA
ncbi:MAG: PIN domain nuclease [Deltaproteobacteria bacterium]|nr:PIN domain nuclease [Deltaproteobacteria bacterium]